MLRQSRVSWDKMPVLQFTVLFALLHKVFRWMQIKGHDVNKIEP
jgi:hypothetical protein